MWRIIERTGSVRSLHLAGPMVPEGPQVQIMRPTDSAVVLGSGQRTGVVDAASARRCNLDVLRRRSGGGLVVVSALEQLWVDIRLREGDPFHQADIGRTFVGIGRLWLGALARCGLEAEIHEGRYEPGPWGALVCFAGRGPGEVFLGGRKVVGLSQRRVRGAARIQCGVLLGWSADATARLVALESPLRAELRSHLATCAVGLKIRPERLLSAFLTELRAGRSAG